MPRVFIIADDLTGALDSAVAFAAPGCLVVVARGAEAVPGALARAPDVLAVATASREIAPEVARARVAEVLSTLPLDDFDIVMKKIDSRLKGNTGPETEVLAEAMNSPRVIVSPAIPDMERIVRHGALTGSGVAEPIDVAARFLRPVEVPEVASDTDLDGCVSGAAQRVLWVGARGLALALSRSLGLRATQPPALDAPVLIVSGSRDPVTLAQLDALKGEVAVQEAPDGGVPEVSSAEALALSISEGGAGLDGAEAASRYAQGILRVAQELEPRSLLICGGETAHAVLDQMRVGSLEVTAELRPGLPLCRIEASWGPLHLVTKSGGFGAPGLLRDILRELRAGQAGTEGHCA
ncbi:four-carbon acid sugar kinase family protein [Alloyangia pacifica]|uniref:four-carbon acid sugar kinase family protein n=1 Tax=Alloyangia pacifica TaxID=311180 RepID=UPI0031E2F3C5